MLQKATWPPPPEPVQLALPLPEIPRLRPQPPADTCHRCGQVHHTRRVMVACMQANSMPAERL